MTGGGFVLPSGNDNDDDEDFHSGDDAFSDEDDNNIRLEMAELGAGHGNASGSGGIAGGGGIGRRREVEWVGKPHVVGPEWMRMPLLTVGMLGLQCVWSIEMGYGEWWKDSYSLSAGRYREGAG